MSGRWSRCLLATLLASLAQAGPLDEARQLWQLRRTRSAIEALQRAAQQPELAAEAQQLLGRIYFFRGWESEGAFPGWHEEPECREKAIAAFRAAIQARPDWAEPRIWLDKALGRATPAAPAGEDALLAAKIEKLRAEKQFAELIPEARSFVARYSASDRLPAVYDALLAAYQATPTASVETIAAAIEARLKSRPDPGAYFTGANLLLSRGALDRAVQLAQEAVPAAETFVNENFGAYKLAEKARGSLNRTRATSADLVGWARFLQGDREAAAARLAEAERLSRGQDFSVQFHLGELARSKEEPAEARERYLSALSLAGGPEALRAAAHKALAEIRTGEGQDPTAFEAWLKTELDRRRQERRAQLLRSMVDRPLPPLTLTSPGGERVDLTPLRGKALLLNFFASW